MNKWANRKVYPTMCNLNSDSRSFQYDANLSLNSDNIFNLYLTSCGVWLLVIMLGASGPLTRELGWQHDFNGFQLKLSYSIYIIVCLKSKIVHMVTLTRKLAAQIDFFCFINICNDEHKNSTKFEIDSSWKCCSKESGKDQSSVETVIEFQSVLSVPYLLVFSEIPSFSLQIFQQMQF